MRNARLTKLAAIIMTAGMLFNLAGCGSGATKSSNVPAAGTGSSKTDATVDLMAKYSTPIELTAWRFLESTTKFENGDTIENNIYMKAYEEQLGIKLKYKWVVPREQFEQKLNVSIASGDLPDIMWVMNKQLSDLAENDMLYDLTDLFNKYASQTTKDVMLQDQMSFNTAKVGNKLMAIPHTASAIDALPFLYVRTDWLTKLGLSEPKTMKDVLAIADAFTKKDPDGNGKADTFGMAIPKSFLTEAHSGAAGFFAGYHAYPRKWIKNSSGQLAYGSILPEVKTALKQLQDMYKDGLLDKEFGVKDRAKVGESVASGKVGLLFGSMSTPLSFLQPNIDNEPNADWKALPVVSIDDKVAVPATKMPIQRYYVVNKKSKNPEAIMKILNFYTEKSYSKNADNEYGTNKNGIGTFQYNLIGCEPARKNLDAHLRIMDAFKTKDPSKLNTEEKGYYDKIVDFRNGNKKMWGFEHVFGTPSSFDIMNQYVESKNMIYDGFYGAPTTTMVEKNATLEKMEEEVFTKIIMGQSVDTFDKFVEDWKKLGGDQITKEINDWYAKNK